MSDDFSSNRYTAGRLVVGGKVTGVFDTRGDEDWFKITLKAGATYQFMMQGAANGAGTVDGRNNDDTFALFVYDSEGYHLNGSSLRTASTGNLPAMSFTAPYDGDYYVSASAWGSQTGSYTLTATQGPNDDHGDTEAKATPITAGTTINGSLGLINDIDVFSSTLEAGLLYQLEVRASGTAGLSFGSSWFDTSTAAPGETMVITGAPETAATYYARVSSTSGTPSYTITLSRLSDDYPSNTKTTGQLAVNGSVSGKIDAPNDADWIRVDLAAGGYLFSTAGAGSGEVFLRQPSAFDGRVSSFSLGADGSFLTDGGTYYIHVSAAQAGAYTLGLSVANDDHGNNEATATQLPASGKVTGHINFERDQDAFRVHAQQGHLYRLTYTLQGGSGAHAAWNFGNAFNDYEKAWFRVMQSAAETSNSLDFFAYKDLDFTVVLSSFYKAAPSGYTLQLEDLGTDDHGNTAEMATALGVAGLASSRIDHGKDVDVFRAQFQWGLTYKIAVTGDDGARIGTTVPGYNSTTKTLTVTPKAGEDVVVYVAGGAATSYGIKVEQLADDYSANPSTTGRLAIGETATGTLEGYADRDWFAMELKANTTYVFSTSSEIYGIGVANASGAIVSGDLVYDYSRKSLSYTPQASGTYYLQASFYDSGAVQNASSQATAYSITSGTSALDDHPEPRLITAGQLVSGSIQSSADVDTFMFDVKAGHLYTLDIHTRNKDSGYDYTLSNYTLRALTKGLYDAHIYSGTHLAPAADGRYSMSFSAMLNYAMAQYDIKLVDHGVDDYPSSAPLQANVEIGKTASGAIQVDGDIDAFSFSAAQGQRFAVLVTGQPLAGHKALAPGDIKLDFGASTAGWSGGYYGRGSASFITFSANGNGTLAANIGAHNTGGYSVQVVDVSGDKTAPQLLTQQDSKLAPNEAMRITFSETVGQAISGGGFYDSTSYFIKNNGDQTAQYFGAQLVKNVSWDGNSLVIKGNLPWLPGVTYTLEPSNTTIIDLAGNTMKLPDIRFVGAPAASAPGNGNDAYIGKLDGARIDGGAGQDTVFYTDVPLRHTVKGAGNGSFTISGLGKSDTLVGIERILFSESADGIALDINGIGGQAYRLYQAAFNRTPDKGGVGFWMSAMEKGFTLKQVAEQFISSAEFKSLYGDKPSDAEFVNLLYQNVLHRAGEAGGVNFWLGVLANGLDRAEVLASFSESPENQSNTLVVIGDGFVYTPYY